MNKTGKETLFLENYQVLSLYSVYTVYGAKGDWDFRISDLVKNPDGTDI